jgi:hypothetical protein
MLIYLKTKDTSPKPAQDNEFFISFSAFSKTGKQFLGYISEDDPKTRCLLMVTDLN